MLSNVILYSRTGFKYTGHKTYHHCLFVRDGTNNPPRLIRQYLVWFIFTSFLFNIINSNILLDKVNPVSLDFGFTITVLDTEYLHYFNNIIKLVCLIKHKYFFCTHKGNNQTGFAMLIISKQELSKHNFTWVFLTFLLNFFFT